MAMTGATRRALAHQSLIGLAWALWALAVLGVAAAARLNQVLHDAGRTDLFIITPGAVAPLVGAVGVATVGAVLASRRPRHPVGWLMLVQGLSLSTAGAAASYVNYGVAHASAAPGAGLAAPYVPATIVVAIVT